MGGKTNLTKAAMLAAAFLKIIPSVFYKLLNYIN